MLQATHHSSHCVVEVLQYSQVLIFGIDPQSDHEDK